ncbi:unnamed protein product [Heterosigma akashiwo]|mmetsp:Transcript_1646/g.2858  ORF Transcript_1646/g.2858 Transcript_1646/m.2858 type:complete len:339 (-) Transcript_1646:173-1189(-)
MGQDLILRAEEAPARITREGDVDSTVDLSALLSRIEALETRLCGAESNKEEEVEFKEGQTEMVDDLQFFADSTHCFMFHDEIVLAHGIKYRVTFSDRIFAYFVVAFQIGVYLFVIALSLQEFHDANNYSPVLIYDPTWECYNGKTVDPSTLWCDTGFNWSGMTVSATVAGFFIVITVSPDISQAYAMFRDCSQPGAKSSAVLITIEALAAVIAGATVTHLMFLHGVTELILSVVGVAFLHDMDECLRNTFDQLGSSKKMMAQILAVYAIFGTAQRISSVLLENKNNQLHFIFVDVLFWASASQLFVSLILYRSKSAIICSAALLGTVVSYLLVVVYFV